MEPTNNGTPRRRPNPRRRKINRIKRLIRAWLPIVGVLALVGLFIIFAVNSVKRADAKREQERLESIAVEESLAQAQHSGNLCLTKRPTLPVQIPANQTESQTVLSVS